MDKNSIFGIVIIAAILIGWGVWNTPSAQEVAEMKRQDSLARAQSKELPVVNESVETLKIENDTAIIANKDSVIKSENVARYGTYLAKALEEDEKLLTITTDSLTIEFSSKGGQIKKLRLNGYKTWDGKPLNLINDNSSFGFGILKYAANSKLFNFKPSISNREVTVEDEFLKVEYTLQMAEDKSVIYTYTIPKSGYLIDFDMTVNNAYDYISPGAFDISWEKDIHGFEKAHKTEQQYSFIQFYYDEEDDEELSPTSPDEAVVEKSAKWVAFKQQFFSSVIIAKDKFDGGDVASEPATEGVILKHYKTNLSIPLSGNKAEMQFYFGPNHFPTLKKIGVGLEKLVPLGWGIFGWVNRIAVIPIFNWLRGFISNYGLIILLLTLIIKVVLFPLMYKSYLSTARMRVLKPEVEEINKKFTEKDQMMKRQQATMELYRKAGVNPLGGCLPMLIQFPILIAMFKFFPASIELRQKAFLWATDLSSFDTLPFLEWDQHIWLLSDFYGNHISILTLLMAASMYFTTKLNSASMTTAPGQPNMNVIMNLMPIMMLFFFNNYASGLSLYYFIANVVTLLQTWIIRRFIDDEAILAKLKENKKKPKKKSKFQQRLEDMQKMQKEMQKRR